MRIPLYAESNLVHSAEDAAVQTPDVHMSRALLPSAPVGSSHKGRSGPSMIQLVV
ncbi:hypothetical protein MASR2M48_30370 [Spirochaetota bacterium]